VFLLDKNMSKEQKEKMSEQIKNKFSGGSNSYKPFITN
jgi:hypothetical protein